MKTKEFVTKYNKSTDKEGFVKEHITKQYLPYANKFGICKTVIDKTMYTDVNGEKMLYENTPKQYMFFSLLLLSHYTDIEIDYENNLEEYDALDEAGLIDTIIGTIPQREVEKINVMLSMMRDDIYKNERDIVSFLDTKFKALEIILDKALGTIGEGMIEKMTRTDTNEEK